MARGHDTPELRHIRCFLAVAETLKFSTAAHNLGMSQPPLSQQIQRLEAQIGHALFERGRAGKARVRLTPAGQALLGPARRLLAGAESALELARRGGSGDAGRLRLGFVSSCAATVLAPLIRRFRQAHPGVDLELIEMTTMQQAKALEDGRIDVGLGRDVVSFGERYGFANVSDDDIMALLPWDHPLAASPVISLQALANSDFILFPRSRGDTFYDVMIAPCIRAGFQPRVVQEATEWLTIMALVAAGIGVSLVPRRVSDFAPSGSVVVPIDDARAVTSIDLWWWAADEAELVRKFLVTAALHQDG